MQVNGAPNPYMQNSYSVDPLPLGWPNASMQSPETVPAGLIRQGRIGCALLGPLGGKQVRPVGCMAVPPESLQRGLWVPAEYVVEFYPLNWFLQGRFRGMHIIGQLQPVELVVYFSYCCCRDFSQWMDLTFFLFYSLANILIGHDENIPYAAFQSI
jgi:hypothetical protein